jgi:hypothetical protein
MMRDYKKKKINKNDKKYVEENKRSSSGRMLGHQHKMNIIKPHHIVAKN